LQPPTMGRSPHACNGITFRLLFIVDVTISKSQPIWFIHMCINNDNCSLINNSQSNNGC
jgi:hypothetical protein